METHQHRKDPPWSCIIQRSPRRSHPIVLRKLPIRRWRDRDRTHFEGDCWLWEEESKLGHSGLPENPHSSSITPALGHYSWQDHSLGCEEAHCTCTHKVEPCCDQSRYLRRCRRWDRWETVPRILGQQRGRPWNLRKFRLQYGLSWQGLEPLCKWFGSLATRYSSRRCTKTSS